MPTPQYALMMARYNLWQNENLIGAATGLPDGERERERGAFFGSIQKTFFHLFWADRVWMSRLAATPPPGGGPQDSIRFQGDWSGFCRQRAALDRQILQWAATVEASWFDGHQSWVARMSGRLVSGPRTELVVQMFNHQTHHRGQIHAMLTAAGAQPDDTDVPRMPDRYRNLVA